LKAPVPVLRHQGIGEDGVQSKKSGSAAESIGRAGDSIRSASNPGVDESGHGIRVEAEIEPALGGHADAIDGGVEIEAVAACRQIGAAQIDATERSDQGGHTGLQ
jgi:hypothetical protein